MGHSESKRIGVGIIGASAGRGWARAAHIPALQALDEYALRAVSTGRVETAQRSGRAYGVDLAFGNQQDLLARPEVELAVIAVNVTLHHEAALAAIEAGKMVFCEWPLGQNLQDAEEIAKAARQKGVRTVIGLQGRFSPAVQHLRELVSGGALGTLLGTTMRGCGPDEVWAGRLEPALEFHADRANGATLLSIVAGHALDMMAFALGEFATVSSTLVTRRQSVRLRDNALLSNDAPDQVAVSGVLRSGALASVHYHGGPLPGPAFVWEVNGTEGSVVLTADRGYANMAPMTIQASYGASPLQEVPMPAGLRPAPSTLQGPAANVASLYVQFARDLVDGTSLAPDFEAAVRRHRLLDAIERADATGTRQVVPD